MRRNKDIPLEGEKKPFPHTDLTIQVPLQLCSPRLSGEWVTGRRDPHQKEAHDSGVLTESIVL